ncbi:sit4 [Anaeramoeba ignava]|uniref:Sit4 n=1 Tax=Anaeramoeba ignava TaxID=1746090 RepID=A0A9Q0LU38_ANAIG|nr:sit4 [Anaeramoeba ignava]
MELKKFTRTSSITTLLKKPNVSIEDLFENDYLFDELRNNEKLKIYFLKPENLEKILQYFFNEQITNFTISEKIEEKIFKYSNIANQIICSEQIVPRLTEDNKILEMIFSRIYLPSIEKFHNQLSRIIMLIISTNASNVINFLESKESIFDHFLLHFDYETIAEIFTHLFTLSKSEIEKVDQWLSKTNFVSKLLQLLSPKFSMNFHYNSSHCLISAISSPHLLSESLVLSQILQESTINEIFQRIFENNPISPSIFQSGLDIITQILVKVDFSNEFEDENDLMKITESLIDKLDKLCLLLSENKPSEIKLSFGNLTPPLGVIRFKIVEFIHFLVRIESPELIEKICEIKIFKPILDLFFEYKWNNFLHNQVRDMILYVIEYGSPNLLKSLFFDCNLIQRILEVVPTTELKEPIKILNQAGYFSHLAKISNLVIELSEMDEDISQTIDEQSDLWNGYVENFLDFINEIQEVSDLPQHKAFDDSDDDFYDFQEDQIFSEKIPSDNQPKKKRDPVSQQFIDYLEEDLGFEDGDEDDTNDNDNDNDNDNLENQTSSDSDDETNQTSLQNNISQEKISDEDFENFNFKNHSKNSLKNQDSNDQENKQNKVNHKFDDHEKYEMDFLNDLENSLNLDEIQDKIEKLIQLGDDEEKQKRNESNQD